jgi:hypothetical protein
MKLKRTERPIKGQTDNSRFKSVCQQISDHGHTNGRC